LTPFVETCPYAVAFLQPCQKLACVLCACLLGASSLAGLPRTVYAKINTTTNPPQPMREQNKHNIIRTDCQAPSHPSAFHDFRFSGFCSTLFATLLLQCAFVAAFGTKLSPEHVVPSFRLFLVGHICAGRAHQEQINMHRENMKKNCAESGPENETVIWSSFPSTLRCNTVFVFRPRAQK
jgi:hypothetical protein